MGWCRNTVEDAGNRCSLDLVSQGSLDQALVSRCTWCSLRVGISGLIPVTRPHGFSTSTQRTVPSRPRFYLLSAACLEPLLLGSRLERRGRPCRCHVLH